MIPSHPPPTPNRVRTTSVLYDPWTDHVWPLAPSDGLLASDHTATLLVDGRVLIVESGDSPRAHVFDPAPWRPAHGRPRVDGHFEFATRIMLDIPIFDIGEGSGGNGAQNAATNHPLVELQSLANDQVRYFLPEPSQGWSTGSFISAPIADFPPGPALLTAWAGGSPRQKSVIVVDCRPDINCYDLAVPATHRISLPLVGWHRSNALR